MGRKVWRVGTGRKELRVGLGLVSRRRGDGSPQRREWLCCWGRGVLGLGVGALQQGMAGLG